MQPRSSGAWAEAVALIVTKSVPRRTSRTSLRSRPSQALFQNRVRFHVDNRLARRGRLDVSSRLLALAISVRED